MEKEFVKAITILNECIQDTKQMQEHFDVLNHQQQMLNLEILIQKQKDAFEAVQQMYKKSTEKKGK